MHDGLCAGPEIDDASHGAVGVHEPEPVGPDDLVVGGEVGVVVHVGREAGGGVDDVEGHGVVDERGPGGGLVGRDDGAPGSGVPGYVVRESREAMGELGVVAGSGVGHCGGLANGKVPAFREVRGVFSNSWELR